MDNLIENDYKNKADNDSNHHIKNNLNSNKIQEITNLNKDVIDLRIDLENQVLEEIKQKNILLANNELLDKVDDKISTIKNFRTFGLLPEESTIKSKNRIKNKKMTSEFEKRRFIKAVNNIINEKLKDKNINMENLCSCGNLSKKINAMIEKDNLNILSDIECEKNCSLNKNKNNYLDIINEVLKSVKDSLFNNNNQHQE